MMKKMLFGKIQALMLILVVSFLTSCAKSKDDTIDDPLIIGIAWRSDLDSEFYVNVVASMKECNVTPVLLKQVINKGVPYIDGSVSPVCVDKNGYLTSATASMVRTTFDNSNAADVMEKVDAVIFTGGEDISPTLFAVPQPWHGIEAERDYNATRDVNDFTLMTYCIKNDINVLGLCRGMQMLGVVSGATAIQDIPTFFKQKGEDYNYIHRNEKTSPEAYRDYSPHNVTVETGSILYDMTGGVIQNAPSWHHQSLLSIDGTSLKMSGYLIVKGMKMIEAIERKDKSTIMGLQFHPEAAIVKHTTGATNKGSFMSVSDAKKIINAFIMRTKIRTNQN